MDDFKTVEASEKGAFLHLISPRTNQPAFIESDDGKELDENRIGITLFGRDSAAYKSKVRKRGAKMAKRRAGGANVKRMSHDQIVGMIEENEKSSVQDAADAVKDWQNISVDGQNLEFTRENAVMLFSDFPAILEQVGDFLENRANFFETA